MMMITRDVHNVLACSMVTVHVPVMVVAGEAVGAVVMVQVQEPVTGRVDGLVTMVPTTSRHVTDTEDSFL